MQIKATMESQLKGVYFPMEDTEEMYWLRQNDDYQSKVELGMLLVKQYRYLEAVEAFKFASLIKSDDPLLYSRLGGAYLTLLQYDEAKAAYEQAISLGISEQAVSYPLAIWNFLQEQYEEAAELLEKCLPCGDEMKIAVIYWHMLACLRMNVNSKIRNLYEETMEVGHHKAYKWAVEVMLGKRNASDLLVKLEKVDDLSFIVAAYGVTRYYEFQGELEKARELRKEILKRDSMWPSIPYLTAYVDAEKQI